MLYTTYIPAPHRANNFQILCVMYMFLNSLLDLYFHFRMLDHLLRAVMLPINNQHIYPIIHRLKDGITECFQGGFFCI